MGRNFFLYGYPVDAASFIEKTNFSSLQWIIHHKSGVYACVCEGLFVNSLFHWSIFISLHQYHTVLITWLCRNKGIWTVNKEVKMSFLAKDMILYVENPKASK